MVADLAIQEVGAPSSTVELRSSDLVALRDITHAASTDLTRGILAGVLIQAGPEGTAEAWATDSFMAVRRPLSFTLEVGAYGVFYAKELKDAATAALKSNVIHFALEFGHDPAIHAGANRYSVGAIVDADFPKMRQVVDDDYSGQEGTTRVGISSALIARATKALSAPKKNSRPSPGPDLLFEFKDNCKPIMVTPMDPTDLEGATAWIMPVRLA